MRYLWILLLLLLVGCEFAEPIGNVLKDAAPIVKAVTPPIYGDILYTVLMGVGTILTGYGAHRGYRHIKNRKGT